MSEFHKIQITSNGKGRAQSILLDDKPLETVRAVDIELRPGKLALVKLTMDAKIYLDADPAEVEFDAGECDSSKGTLSNCH